MALTATYDPVLSRIRLSGTALNVASTYMVVERSTDNFITSDFVRGGSHKAIAGGVGKLDDYEFPAGVLLWYRVTAYDVGNVQRATFITTITQDLDSDWIKVPAAPFLNRKIVVSDIGDRSLPARQSIFDIIGRSDPVSVADIRSSKRFDAKLYTFSAQEEEDLEYLLSSGEIIFIHLPVANKCMPGGYYAVGDVTWNATGSKARPKRTWNLPLTGVAPPAPDIVGSSYTWQSVLNDYGSWSAVLAANASWAALLERVGDPGDVIVS
jgi:hypothetical protein